MWDVFLADTRPHKLCQCDQEMGTAASCTLSHAKISLRSVSAHVHTHKFNHLANSIHSSMNSLETDNEYFPKPTSVRNRPGYIRTATDGLYQFCNFVQKTCGSLKPKIFGGPGFIPGLYLV